MAVRSWFARKPAPLTGAPAVRRTKTYSAQSGFVYQYCYQGHRPFRAGGHPGEEFVFSVSANRKDSLPVTVRVPAAASLAWEETHSRRLTSTERYAVAKMALFQAFDERPTPARMQDEIIVRPADLEAIIETLGL
jgi:hypothetical protein